MKITTKCGDDAVQALNETLLVKAAQAKLLRVNKVRLDTTVIGVACQDNRTTPGASRWTITQGLRTRVHGPVGGPG